MIETWVPINGYELSYYVSDQGNIKRMVGYRAHKERVLKGSVHRGYKMVTLSINDVHDRRMVHRIVADAFIPNPDNKPFINNLAWCTQSENIKHAFNIGNKIPPRTKLTADQVRSIRIKYQTGNYTEQELAKEFGVSRGAISGIKLLVTWKHIL